MANAGSFVAAIVHFVLTITHSSVSIWRSGACSSGCLDFDAFNIPTAGWCYYEGGGSCWIGDSDNNGQPVCGLTQEYILNGNTGVPSDWPSFAPLDARECPWDILPESLCGGVVSIIGTHEFF